mgnify:CR=1 FL=1
MKQANIVKRMKPLLGTYVEIGFLNNGCQTDSFNAAFSSIENIQNQMSFHNPQSALSQLNHSQGEWIELPRESIEVLNYTKQLFIETKGLFNCTLGGHLVQNDKLPNHFNVPFIPVGSGDDIEISQNRVRLLAPIIITLDGIAKGYAVDQAIESLIKTGVTTGWVNAGGDIRVFGELKMPIHQRHENALLPLIELNNQAIATSQVSQKNPTDLPGYIIDNEGKQPKDCIISVIAAEAWLADALTKVLALTSEELRQTLAQRFSATYVKS